MNLERCRHAYLRCVVVPALRMLPYPTALRLAETAGRLVHSLRTPARAAAEARIQRALGLPPAAAAAIASQMYRCLGRFWIDLLFAGRLLRPGRWRHHIHIDREDEEALRDLPRRGRGCIFTTASFGNPIVLACALGRLVGRIHVVMADLPPAVLREWQSELRGWPVVLLPKSRSAAMLPAVLRAGGAVLMTCDTPRPRGPAVDVDFLGRPTRLYPTLDRLARWLDVPVAVLTCRPTGNSSAATRRGALWPDPFAFDVECHAILQAHPRDQTFIVRRAAALIERAVLHDPSNYLWIATEEHRPAGRIIDPTPHLTRTETGSASSPRTYRKTSAPRRPSTAGSRRESPAAAAVR